MMTGTAGIILHRRVALLNIATIFGGISLSELYIFSSYLPASSEVKKFVRNDLLNGLTLRTLLKKRVISAFSQLQDSSKKETHQKKIRIRNINQKGDTMLSALIYIFNVKKLTNYSN